MKNFNILGFTEKSDFFEGGGGGSQKTNMPKKGGLASLQI